MIKTHVNAVGLKAIREALNFHLNCTAMQSGEDPEVLRARIMSQVTLNLDTERVAFRNVKGAKSIPNRGR